MAMAEADTQDMSDNLSRPALNSPNTARLSILCLALGFTSAHAIEYETTEDYIAISIETEEFDTKDDRWVLTNASTGQLAPELDPDPNHSDTASGGVYFELLPDTRVTHEDPIVGGFWGPPAAGRSAVAPYKFAAPENERGLGQVINETQEVRLVEYRIPAFSISKTQVLTPLMFRPEKMDSNSIN